MVKFIMGRDLVVTHSSFDPCGARFAIAAVQAVELKWSTQKMIPFITCEISLGQYVCELVFGVDVFDLDFGVQIISIEQPIKSNFVSSGDVSHCWTSASNYHLNGFIVFKHTQFCFMMRGLNI